MAQYDVVFTDTQFIQLLEHIANDLPTAYNNNFPRNCGYYTGNEWTWDCWNLIKTLIWGWSEDTTVGSYTFSPGLHGLGDWNGIQILNHCTDRSYDFSLLSGAEYLYYQGSVDHAGIYIGNKTVNGHTVNVVECTPIWNGGVQYSFIDSNGVRYEYQGATPSITWTAHGKLPWVHYAGQPTPPTPPHPIITSREGLPIWMMIKYQF